MYDNFFILLLSIVGFYISLYFTLVYYGIISPSRFILPEVCKLSENACQSIINTKYARILGLPNFVYGLLYYIVVFLFAIFNFNGYIKTALMLISFVTVVLGVYLIYVLMKVLKVNCLLCFISHVVNFFILVFFVLK